MVVPVLSHYPQDSGYHAMAGDNYSILLVSPGVTHSDQDMGGAASCHSPWCSLLTVSTRTRFVGEAHNSGGTNVCGAPCIWGHMPQAGRTNGRWERVPIACEMEISKLHDKEKTSPSSGMVKATSQNFSSRAMTLPVT